VIHIHKTKSPMLEKIMIANRNPLALFYNFYVRILLTSIVTLME
jgi:hypothetical protein